MERWGTLKKWLKSDTALLVGLALIGLIDQLVFSRGYRYFRDEFYNLAAAPGTFRWLASSNPDIGGTQS